MPFCKKCGYKLEDDAAFCPSCGTPNALSKGSNSKNNSATVNSNNGGYAGTSNNDDSTLRANDHGSYGISLNNLSKGFELESRYRIEEKLGRGGFGTVYKAWDNNTDSWKALKIIDDNFYDDKRVIADLKREAKLLMKLNSGYVVRVWDVHLIGEIKFIDMEYVEGGDLEDLLISYPDHIVPEDIVTDLLKAISQGMIDIHKHSIIHKDLKPQNIMLTKTGDIKIMDFGISETFRSSKSRMKESSKSGTPAYMSPEQLLGKDVGKEADIWSVGVMVYELLSGKQLFKGTTTNEVYFQIEHRDFEPISNVSDKLNNILQNCLQMNFRARFKDFQELLNFINQQHISAKEQEIKETADVKYSKNESNIKNKQPKPADTISNLNKQETKESQVNKDSIEVIDEQAKNLKTNMVFVKGGTFLLGNYKGPINEQPPHKVTLNDYSIGKYCVTQKEWREVMGDNPSYFKKEVVIEEGFLGFGKVVEESDGNEHPVEQVSWFDVIEFCNKKSLIEGLIPCYSGKESAIKCDFSVNGYRLPTEAEWEYAARGGYNSEGYKYSGSSNIDEVAWYEGNYPSEAGYLNDSGTCPVGKKKENELGIYDMSGNVLEWCYDWYDLYKGKSEVNPSGASSSYSRVARGGSWENSVSYCRTKLRNFFTPGLKSSNLGFRLVRSMIK